MQRSASMPETDSIMFPMRVREINDLGSLHDLGEYTGDHNELQKRTKKVKDRIAKTMCKFSDDAEIDGTEDTVEDDYGFFPMDDDNDSQGREPEDQSNAFPEDAVSTSNSDDSSDQLCSSYEHYRSSSATRRFRKKSALKRGSSYGDSDEGIPLDFERKEFNRVLPKPDLLNRVAISSSQPSKGITRSGSRGLFRVSSEPVFVRPVYQPDEIDDSVSSSKFVEGAMKKRISFGTIQIREHEQTIGDNPSCSYGTPVQLDWEHQDLEELDFYEYESCRTEIRNKEQFHLNHFQRSNMLKLNGFSTNEIKDTKRRVGKVRRQRERTKFLAMNYPTLVTVEDAIESGLRKVKRSVSKSKLNANDDGDSIPRKSSKDDLAIYPSGITKGLLLDVMDNDQSNVTAPF